MPYPDRAFNAARQPNLNPLQQVEMVKHQVGTAKIKMADKGISFSDKVVADKSNPIGLRAYAANASNLFKDSKAKFSDQTYNTGTFFQEKRWNK